jgi:hypothetical protein
MASMPAHVPAPANDPVYNPFLKSRSKSLKLLPFVHYKEYNMTIEMDDTICRGLLEYSRKHNIRIERIIEESALQNQTRHNIDMDGNIYPEKANKPIDVHDLVGLAGKMNYGGNVITTSKECFGTIFDNLKIRNYKYIIGTYKKIHTMIFVTENEKEVTERISKNKLIGIERVEDNQSYCWLAAYNTMVLTTRFSANEDVIILVTAGNP